MGVAWKLPRFLDDLLGVTNLHGITHEIPPFPVERGCPCSRVCLISGPFQEPATLFHAGDFVGLLLLFCFDLERHWLVSMRQGPTSSGAPSWGNKKGMKHFWKARTEEAMLMDSAVSWGDSELDVVVLSDTWRRHTKGLWGTRVGGRPWMSHLLYFLKTLFIHTGCPGHMHSLSFCFPPQLSSLLHVLSFYFVFNL